MKNIKRPLTTLLGIATCLSGQLKALGDNISASVESGFINNYIRLRGTKVADDGILSKANLHMDEKFSKLPVDFDFSVCRFEPLDEIDRKAQTNDWSLTATDKFDNGMKAYVRVGQFNYENKLGANSNNFEGGVFVPNSIGGSYGAEIHHTPQWDNVSVTFSNSASKEMDNGGTVTGKAFIRGFKVNDNPELVVGYKTAASWQLGEHAHVIAGAEIVYNNEHGTQTGGFVKLKANF